MTFLILENDGSYSNNITVWAYATKSAALVKTETDNWFRVVVRDHQALGSLLSVGNRLQWNSIVLEITVWEKILYDRKGYVEILCKQVVSSDSTEDTVLFPDIVSLYAMTKTTETNYGLTSYKYSYDFTTPTYTGVRCKFPAIDKSFIKESKVDVEYDRIVVLFNANAPITIEDYLISPIYGKFKVQMIVKNRDGMIEASVDRSDIQ